MNAQTEMTLLPLPKCKHYACGKTIYGDLQMTDMPEGEPYHAIPGQIMLYTAEQMHEYALAHLTKPDAGGGEGVCQTCNGHGAVGRAPDDYFDCPDCTLCRPSVVPMPEPDGCDTCGNSGFVSECVNGVPIGEGCPDCSSSVPVTPEPDGYIWRGTVLKENWKFSGPEDKDQMNYMVEYRYNGVSTYEVKPVYFKPVRQIHTDTEGE